MLRFIVPVVAFAAVPACASDVLELSVSTEDVEVNNGENLNGENLNGENLNGENLNGENLNGPRTGVFTIWTSLEGVRLGDITFDTTTLDASVFTGTYAGGTITGTNMLGAEFIAMRGDGTTVTLRLSDARPPVAPATAWFYYVDYFDENEQAWLPTCKNSDGQLAAVPVAGIWDHHLGEPGGGAHITSDPTKFTFGCEKTGAIGKCVTFGYEPWRSIDGVSLNAYHESCVRLVRADYCGNGHSYTRNGRLINLYDNLGIQLDTDDWPVEAEWNPDGALCVTDHHRATGEIACDTHPEVDCGNLAHFSTGTLMMNELP